ncbi:MAG TPA: hypothetical protein VLD67_00825 [Vicinamibacterales bacterium]|nr:hypothetical protein [Vicinamibacterales bacterium]
MKRALVPLLGVTLAAGCSGGGGSADDSGGGDARVTIAGKAFTVNNVRFIHELGDDGYFRVEGDDAAHPQEDCVPGLSGGLALYGEMPSTVTSLRDLNGMELPFEFSGDGDDANLCFVGSNGLLGVERGTVRFGAVEGTKLAFTFSGSFVLYDGVGGQSPSEVSAMGSGIAHVAIQ